MTSNSITPAASATVTDLETVSATPLSVTEGQFGQLADIAKVDLNQGPEQLLALGIDEMNRAETSVLRAGAYFLKLKALTCRQGQRSDLPTALSGIDESGFEAALERAGVNPRSAQRAMQYANYLAALPPKEAQRISQLPKMKVLALASADPEVVQSLLESGSLDGKEALSLRELQRRLKDSESARTRADTELNKYRQQARAQAALRASEDLPMFAREPREEALVASEAMMQSLELIDDAVLRNLLAEVDHSEALRWQPAAARTVVYALAPVAMRIGRLIKELRERFGESVVGPLDADSFLEPSEALQLMMGRAQLIKQAMELAQGRADTRANTTPGKRGRKRGSSADASA